MNLGILQCQQGFQLFEMNFEKLAHKILLLEDFNAQSKNWCSNGVVNFEGRTIENNTESTHILNNSSLSVGLIFTTKHNLLMES